MKIALLSDVHANLPALHKVVMHARTHQADEFWNLGDMVGYAPFPSETVLALKDLCCRHVVGNYDLKVLSEKRILRMQTLGKDGDKVFSFAWTHKNLSEDARVFIEGMPREDRCDIHGRRILLTHASPDGIEEGVTLRTSSARLRAMAQRADAEIILCGHTHRFLERKEDGVLWINPGSVGRSFDGDPRASYAMIEILPQGVKVHHFRVAYPADEALQEMEHRQFPVRLMRSLKEARSLDDLDDRTLLESDKILKTVLELARECRYEKEHAHQVTKLALRLFEELEALHGLGLRERLLLQVAALLHDTGLVYGVEAHHKASRDIILKADKLALTERDRKIVALIARYHRKTIPLNGHKYYEDLSFYDREIVDILSAILRVADGLDRTHQGLVKDVVLEILPDQIVAKIDASASTDQERETARLKADLWEKALGRPLVL